MILKNEKYIFIWVKKIFLQYLLFINNIYFTKKKKYKSRKSLRSKCIY